MLLSEKQGAWQKPRRVSPRRAKSNENPLYPAAPPTGTILLASQVWNLCGFAAQIMRAVEAICIFPVGKPPDKMNFHFISPYGAKLYEVF